MTKKNISIFKIFLIIFLVTFMIWNTGMFADDYSESRNRFGKVFFDFSYENLGIMIFRIPEYLLFYHIYHFVEITKNTSFDFFKIAIILVSIKLVYDFAKVIFNNNKNISLLFSLIFVFYPSHDTILYYFQVQIYSLFLPALFFYSVGKIIKGKKTIINRIIFFLCSFFSYASPPYVFGSIFFFYIKKKKFDSFLAAIYFVGYSSIYIFLSKLYPLRSRIDYGTIDFIQFLKNFFLQLVTSIDANIGLSFIYKNLISYFEGSITTVLVLIIFIILFLSVRYKIEKINYKVLVFFLLIFLSSLGMYALTNQYPQTPFNVANRVTIYFAPIISYLIVSFIKNLKRKIFVVFAIIIPVFFLTDHAKKWNLEKEAIEKKITIKMLDNLNLVNKTIFIDKFQYSKLGKIYHLDYLISPWITESIFKSKNIRIIHSRVDVKNDKFFDNKFKFEIILNKEIYYYDLEINEIRKISKYELIDLINKRKTKPEIRHVIQIIMNENLKRLFLKFYPNYKYLF